MVCFFFFVGWCFLGVCKDFPRPPFTQKRKIPYRKASTIAWVCCNFLGTMISFHTIVVVSIVGSHLVCRAQQQRSQGSFQCCNPNPRLRDTTRMLKWSNPVTGKLFLNSHNPISFATPRNENPSSWLVPEILTRFKFLGDC